MLSKTVVYCIAEPVVAILTLSVAMFADAVAELPAVYTYDAIF